MDLVGSGVLSETGKAWEGVCIGRVEPTSENINQAHFDVLTTSPKASTHPCPSIRSHKIC